MSMGLLNTIKRWFGGSASAQTSVDSPMARGKTTSLKSLVPKPAIMGMAAGTSFKVDTLFVELLLDRLVVSGISPVQIIHSAGVVHMDGNTLLRFYTDDDAWLQVVCNGEAKPDNIIDVKLFHFYNTESISAKDWNEVLYGEVSQDTYTIEGHIYTPVWAGAGRASAPVHLKELCYDATSDEPDETSQFAMLYERQLGSDGDDYEFLFVSAEEKFVDGQAERCLVLSTGINLTPTQLTVI